jgi:hypothetical protein
MTRLFLLLSLSLTSALLGQQDWQGEIKQIYKVDVPPYQGNALVYGKAEKGQNLVAPVEMYSVILKPTDLKIPTAFYRSTLEKQGFKTVNAFSTPTLEKIQMLHAGRKLTAVVLAQKQNAARMMVGVSVMPEGTIEKAQVKK